jgi:mannose-6-phosphate isomerase-like protein (cupin superfamily)
LAIVVATVAVNAQQTGFSDRRILQRASASVGDLDVVTAMHVYRGVVSEPRHTHSGDVSGFVLEGTVTLIRDGQPPLSLTAGQTFFVPSGVVHNVVSAGDSRIVATYVLDKNGPLAIEAQ